MLTTAAPVWNNWARNPSFVVAVQDLLAYLVGRPTDGTSRLVGTELRLQLDSARYQRQVRLLSPTETGPATVNVGAATTEDKDNDENNLLSVSFPQTELGGIYQAELTRQDGTSEIRRYALNVDTKEGDLKTISGSQLADRLQGVDYRYEQATAFHNSVDALAGYNISQWLLALLIVLLIAEQILAYVVSYHPPARRNGEPTPGGLR
jgi:hypothetical protein